jgi:hypothetical protein
MTSRERGGFGNVFIGRTGLSRFVLDFVLVSSKNLDSLGHMENPRKSDKTSIKSMVLCVLRVIGGNGLKWVKVNFYVLCVCHFATPATAHHRATSHCGDASSQPGDTNQI